MELKNKKSNKQSGDIGEKEFVDLVSCLNCGKKLMALPPNYPLYDIQCTGCSFRAQVKSNNTKPKSVVFGAGWDIIEKVLKAGFMIPPLFLNFKWKSNNVLQREIRFYPFIAKKNLKKYKLSPNHKQPNYKMFNYIGLSELPCLVVYKK